MRLALIQFTLYDVTAQELTTILETYQGHRVVNVWAKEISHKYNVVLKCIPKGENNA